MKKYLVLLFLFLPALSFAYQPVFVFPDSSDDRIVIEQPELERTYFGELIGFPQTYEINALTPFTLTAQVLLPDRESIGGFRSVIVVKTAKRGVDEVTRFQYNPNTAQSQSDRSTGDRYKEGALYQEELEAGTYYIEVSTADNIGKYVLLVGQGDMLVTPNYLEKLAGILKVKHFFGKPMIAVFQSPYYYIPLVLLMLISIVGYRKYRKRYVS